MTQPNPNKRQIKLDAPSDLTAIYSNLVMIGHTRNEFLFDFIQIVPHDPKARVKSRIVMTPVHAKMLLGALAENIRRYEDKHGEIELPARPASLADQLFSNVTGGDEPEDG